MELAISFQPLGNTTEREIAALAREAEEALTRAPGVKAIKPILKEAPDSGKGGFFEEIGSLLLTVTPIALKQLLPLLRTVLLRSGQPMTEVIIKNHANQISFKFNPREVSVKELVDGVLRLQERQG